LEAAPAPSRLRYNAVSPPEAVMRLTALCAIPAALVLLWVGACESAADRRCAAATREVEQWLAEHKRLEHQDPHPVWDG